MALTTRLLQVKALMFDIIFNNTQSIMLNQSNDTRIVNYLGSHL
jgi:hypothetical protein